MTQAKVSRAIIPPAMMTGIRYIRDKRSQLEKLNGEATDVTAGHIVGLTDALALLLEAVADEAGNPMSPL